MFTNFLKFHTEHKSNGRQKKQLKGACLKVDSNVPPRDFLPLFSCLFKTLNTGSIREDCISCNVCIELHFYINTLHYFRESGMRITKILFPIFHFRYPFRRNLAANESWYESIEFPNHRLSHMLQHLYTPPSIVSCLQFFRLCRLGKKLLSVLHKLIKIP